MKNQLLKHLLNLIPAILFDILYFFKFGANNLIDWVWLVAVFGFAFYFSEVSIHKTSIVEKDLRKTPDEENFDKVVIDTAEPVIQPFPDEHEEALRGEIEDLKSKLAAASTVQEVPQQNAFLEGNGKNSVKKIASRSKAKKVTTTGTTATNETKKKQLPH